MAINIIMDDNPYIVHNNDFQPDGRIAAHAFESYDEFMRDFRRVAVALAVTLDAWALFAVGFVFWVRTPHSPDLRPDMAAKLIVGRPEFSRYANLVDVSKTTRGADSENTRCYTAEFTFQQRGSPAMFKGHAAFYFHEKKWRLGSFWWGDPGNVQSVQVGESESTLP